MILQSRHDGVRVIEQHDHALYSGELAHLWCGPTQAAPPLAMDTVLAIALHDYAWVTVDDLAHISPEALPFDPARGLPHDFMTMPTATKIAFYSGGNDDLVAIHPYAALLVSLHYTAFFSAEGKGGGFLHSERVRRESLGLDLDETRIDSDLAILRFLDLISLYACMAPPDAHAEALPAWLTPTMRCLGVEYTMRFLDADTAAIAPFPFRASWTTTLPFRDLGAARFASAEAFLHAWRAAESQRWSLTLIDEANA